MVTHSDALPGRHPTPFRLSRLISLCILVGVLAFAFAPRFVSATASTAFMRVNQMRYATTAMGCPA